MKPRFEIPGDLTKKLSEVTKRHYRPKLNRLAVAGFTTRSDLLEKQTEVCEKIWEMSGEDTGSGRQLRRLFLSAIFWILHERPIDEKREYYNEFQKAKDNYTAPVVQQNEWRDISGCLPYQAHPDGSIRRVWKHKQQVLVPSTTILGYKNIQFSLNGKRKHFEVSRLIALTFIPNPENKSEVDHINNNPGDNRVENLRWVDHSEQMKNRRAFNQSGLKHIDKAGNRWRVIITRNKKKVIQKLYDTLEDAIKARDEVLASFGL